MTMYKSQEAMLLVNLRVDYKKQQERIEEFEAELTQANAVIQAIRDMPLAMQYPHIILERAEKQVKEGE